MRRSFLSFAFFASIQANWLQGFTAVCLEGTTGIAKGVPKSVPKRGRKCINLQPTPTTKPTKNGPEIINFRPVL